MKATIIGHNWFFPSLSLWLSYNWLWTPSNGELIDSGLNSSLFNNYAAIGRAAENRRPPPPPPPPPPLFLFVMRGIISAVLSNLSPTIHRTLLSGKVAAGWKMSPSEVHEGVKLQTPLCPRPCASKGISSFIDRAGWMSGSRRRRRHPPATSSSSPDCFCFQVTSYLLLQLFQFLRACCMKTEGFCCSRSLGNVHKARLKDNPKKKKSLNASSFHA